MKKMITPIDLREKIHPLDATGEYDWNAQAYQHEACKFGTFNSTSRQTCSGQHNFVDDFPMDSYQD